MSPHLIILQRKYSYVHVSTCSVYNNSVEKIKCSLFHHATMYVLYFNCDMLRVWFDSDGVLIDAGSIAEILLD